MIFFPYRAQIKLHKLPVITIAIAVLCLLVYFAQHRNHIRVEAHAKKVCAELASTSEQGAAAEGYRWGRWSVSCEDAVLHLYFDPDPEKHLVWHIEDLEKRGEAATAERLQAQYRAFADHAPSLLTARLWHDRSRFDPIGMITSSFAHADWEHVIFNLIFFFAFAATVELLIGPVLLAGAVVVLSLGIGTFDHVISHWEGHVGPSLGLSGVVMGMLGLFAYFVPRAKIRFFFWFMLSVGTVGVPAWFVALWYMGWDLFDQLIGVPSRTNFVAHLAGAVFGMLIGVTVFRNKRGWAKDLVFESFDPARDETWLTKLNALMVGPAVAGFAFLAGVFVCAILVTFVTHVWVQLLMVAPAVAAGYHLFRTRRVQPDHERYRLGVAALEARSYEEALKHLKPLAERNYPRALHALGWLHSSAPGALRDEREAARLLTRAAERGHTEAQHLLGTMYADGRGIPRDTPRAIEWYRKAAEAGAPDAAMSLGHLYEHGVGIPADQEQAIALYHRAAILFGKLGRKEDAAAAIRALEGLASRYPAVLALATRLKGAVRT
jgi:membrane associated rhomboid family serine protease